MLSHITMESIVWTLVYEDESIGVPHQSDQICQNFDVGPHIVDLKTQRFRLKFSRVEFLSRFWRIATLGWISNGIPSHIMLFPMILDQTHTSLSTVDWGFVWNWAGGWSASKFTQKWSFFTEFQMELPIRNLVNNQPLFSENWSDIFRRVGLYPG